jgi:hypothetical protein
MGNKKDIGDLYKDEYSELKADPDRAVWDSIEFEVEEKKFYRFIWNQFNIYYLSSIVLFSALAIFSFVRVVSYNGAQPTLNSIYIPQDSIANESSPSTDKSLSVKEKENSIPSIKSIVRKNTISPLNENRDLSSEKGQEDVHAQSLGKLEVKDSLVVPMLPPSVVPVPVKKEPKRRVVIIEQRDTIIQIDTLKSKKRRK